MWATVLMRPDHLKKRIKRNYEQKGFVVPGGTRLS